MTYTTVGFGRPHRGAAIEDYNTLLHDGVCMSYANGGQNPPGPISEKQVFIDFHGFGENISTFIKARPYAAKFPPESV